MRTASTVQYPQVTQRTIERWQEGLRAHELMEFKRAPKAGGYFTIER